jgi:hypothetical protein
MSGLFSFAIVKGLWTEEFVTGLHTALLTVTVIYDVITAMNFQIDFPYMTTCSMKHIKHFRINFFHLLQSGKDIEGGNFLLKASRLHIYH